MPINRTFFPALLILLTAIASISGETIEPSSCSGRMELHLHGKVFTYYSFSDTEPLLLEVKGPARLTLRTRLLLPKHDPIEEKYHISVIRDNESTDVYIVSTLPSHKAVFKDAPDVRPSRPREILLSVPEGNHTYSLLLEKPKGTLAAASVSLTRPWEWRLHLTLTNMYDDNIYRYSPEDIDEFVYHRADYRYQMETYDDLVSSPSLTLYVTRRFSPHLKSRLRLKFSYNLFAVNHDKNYETFSAHLRTTVYKKSSVQVGYFHLPEFLIRPYWDQDTFSTTSGDPATYKRCDFTRNLYSVKVGHQILRSLHGAVYYEHDMYYYNPHFTEYDTKANSFGCEILYDCTSWIQTGFEYAFTRAEAKGYDKTGETITSSDDSDISYDEDYFQGTVRIDLSGHISMPLDLAIGYQIARRYFTTEKSLQEDPYHAGRKDSIHRFSLTTTYDILRTLSLHGKYEFQWRDVNSLGYDRITEVKNYDRNRISLGFEYKI